MINREIILGEILKGMKWKEVECYESIHNYIGTLPDGTKILRKGAASACEGETVIIPINMRDGVILGVGKGNPDWNYSAPHGSGRVLRRDEVKNHYTVSAFKNDMKGIYSSSIGTERWMKHLFLIVESMRSLMLFRTALKSGRS